MRVPPWLALTFVFTMVALLAIGTAAGAVVWLTCMLAASVFSRRKRR